MTKKNPDDYDVNTLMAKTADGFASHSNWRMWMIYGPQRSKSGTRRNDGIDLLRCLLMYSIVVHHCCCHTPLRDNWLAALLFLLTLPAVDAFAGISGWFGLRFSLLKLGRLLLQIGFCSGFMTLASIIAASFGWIEAPHISPGVGWFGVCYIALCFVAPIVDGIARSMCLVRYAKPFACVCLVAVLIGWWCVPATSVSFVLTTGSHSAGTLLVVYLFVRFMRPYFGQLGRMVKLTLLFLSVLSFWLPGTMKAYSGVEALSTVPVGFYASPFVIVASVSLVGLFASIETLPSRLSKQVRFLAPSMFSVYLFHDAHVFGRELFVEWPFEWMARHVALPDAAAFGIWSVVLPLIWSAGVVVVCVALDCTVRRLPVHLLKKMFVLRQDTEDGSRHE